MARAKKHFPFGINQTIYQGSKSIQAIPEILKRENWERVMLLVDPGLNRLGLIKPFENILTKNGKKYFIFDHVRENPEAITIDTEAVPAYNDFKADVIIAVGGGSTLDTAKGVAIVGNSGKKCMDFLGIGQHQQLEHRTYPIIAVSTTAGTGSDVCRNAVICDYDGFKLVPSHDSILPQYSIIDPDLLSSLPHSVAAATSFDAFTHALESFTNMNANDFTELFSLRAMELVGDSIREFVANPAVDEYAQKMSLACMYAGFSLGLASIGQAHVLTHPMGEEPLNMTHGDACALSLPAVIEWNALGCSEKYRIAFNALSKSNISKSDFKAKMLIDWVIKLIRDLKIAEGKTMEDFGYTGEEVKKEMLKHPIFNNKDRMSNEETSYPRVTRMKDFAYLIERTNYYSQVIAGTIPYKFEKNS